VRHRRDRLLHACDRVLVATPEQRGEIAAAVPGHRVGLLDRGVDHERFRPDPAARRALADRYGVPVDRPVVLFSGRVDASKRVLVLAEAVRRLRAAGTPAHLVVAGSGPDEALLRDLLGPDVSLLGPVAQRELARVYAGCDVFAFPSRSETVGNAVGEAMACHLPVLLPAGARTTRWLSRPGEDGVVVLADDAAGWAAALRPLLERPELRAALGAAAGATARGRHRSWRQVLLEDLLPVWHAVAPPTTPAAAPPRHRPTATGTLAQPVAGTGKGVEAPSTPGRSGGERPARSRPVGGRADSRPPTGADGTGAAGASASARADPSAARAGCADGGPGEAGARADHRAGGTGGHADDAGEAG